MTIFSRALSRPPCRKRIYRGTATCWHSFCFGCLDPTSLVSCWYSFGGCSFRRCSSVSRTSCPTPSLLTCYPCRTCRVVSMSIAVRIVVGGCVGSLGLSASPLSGSMLVSTPSIYWLALCLLPTNNPTTSSLVRLLLLSKVILTRALHRMMLRPLEHFASSRIVGSRMSRMVRGLRHIEKGSLPCRMHAIGFLILSLPFLSSLVTSCVLALSDC